MIRIWRSDPRLVAALAFCGAAALASAQTPTLQHSDNAATSQRGDPAMAQRVRDEMLHAWRGYEKYAWGHDELKPVSRKPHDWHSATLLMTPVDALDTLVLMGLTDEAKKAHELIVERLSFDEDVEVKSFEITIRLLGGLLSAHQLTGDAKLLRLADDLGARLLPTFDSPTGMPYMYVNLKTGKTREARSNPAEIGTLILEFGTLSRLTGKPVYFEKAKRALTELARRRSPIGLVGDEIDVRTGKWLSRTSHVGGGIDSYYEYLAKCGILFDDGECRGLWADGKRALDRYLADEVSGGLWYGEADMKTGKRTATTFGALHAFLPAVFALTRDADRARRLQDSCFEMWTRNGIEPDLYDYRAQKVVDASYPLRPEIVESAFLLYRTTHDPKYLAMGRRFFDDLVARCRVADGYTVLDSVATMKKGDLMPSYFLAETLKYLYLLFAPEDTLDLREVVLNTEAHPLRRVPAAGGTNAR
jgi:ER degradation enhancer, mannosidase alpha-like 2